MTPLRHQRTIARSASVEGFGYWSGQEVRVEFRPAAPNAGIVFYLVTSDTEPPVRFPVDLSIREDRGLRTVLRQGEKRVEMIEHVLAALSGLEIDNCEVWVNAEEMPGCDGSAAAFVDAIDSAGVVEHGRFYATFGHYQDDSLWERGKVGGSPTLDKRSFVHRISSRLRIGQRYWPPVVCG